MKKLLIPILICVMLLTGCTKSAEAGFAEFMAKAAQSDEISFAADLKAEFPNKTVELKLGYTQKDGEAVIEVLKPELIAGIKARVTENGAALEYDGAMLDLGRLSDDGKISPLNAVSMLVKAIRDGHLDLAWTEDELLAARIIPADDTAVTLWLNSELVPVNAELSYKDKTLVYIQISDWMMK